MAKRAAAPPDPDVARLESERLRPVPARTVADDLRLLISVLSTLYATPPDSKDDE